MSKRDRHERRQMSTVELWTRSGSWSANACLVRPPSASAPWRVRRTTRIVTLMRGPSDVLPQTSRVTALGGGHRIRPDVADRHRAGRRDGRSRHATFVILSGAVLAATVFYLLRGFRTYHGVRAGPANRQRHGTTRDAVGAGAHHWPVNSRHPEPAEKTAERVR